MDKKTKEEIDDEIKKLIPEIEKRFINKEEKRDLRLFLIAFGINTTKNFTKLLINKSGSIEIDDEMPSPTSLESLLYDIIRELKPKKNMNVSPGMEAAGMKFIKTFAKVGLNKAELNKEQVKDLDSRLKLVVSSIAQNEGENPNKMLDFFDKSDLTLNSLTKYQKTNDEIKEDLRLEALQYNIKYVLNKPDCILNINYKEVKALADAYNANKLEIRVAGEIIRLKEITKLKIFTIENTEAFNNELHWNDALAPEAKKFHKVATWTDERFRQIGKDVTSKFLRPISEWPSSLIAPLNIDIPTLIKSGEGRNIEFKSRFRWDSFAKKIEQNIEYKCLKSIAGFLNTDGGILLIGVGDDGTILGMEDDFNSFIKSNKEDEFKKHFDNLISSYFGKHINASIKLDYHDIEGKTIASVNVLKAVAEVFMKRNGVEEFYIRRSASTEQLNGSEILKYSREHWKS